MGEHQCTRFGISHFEGSPVVRFSIAWVAPLVVAVDGGGDRTLAWLVHINTGPHLTSKRYRPNLRRGPCTSYFSAFRFLLAFCISCSSSCMPKNIFFSHPLRSLCGMPHQPCISLLGWHNSASSPLWGVEGSTNGLIDGPKQFKRIKIHWKNATRAIHFSLRACT